MTKGGYTYILTNRGKTVLYTGVTSNLTSRIHQHKTGGGNGFTAKYNVNRLVYVERHDTIQTAIAREKQIKAGSRADKIALIESINPDWNDLAEMPEYMP